MDTPLIERRVKFKRIQRLGNFVGSARAYRNVIASINVGEPLLISRLQPLKHMPISHDRRNRSPFHATTLSTSSEVYDIETSRRLFVQKPLIRAQADCQSIRHPGSRFHRSLLCWLIYSFVSRKSCHRKLVASSPHS